jgi:hypothetical protein
MSARAPFQGAFKTERRLETGRRRGDGRRGQGEAGGGAGGGVVVNILENFIWL